MGKLVEWNRSVHVLVEIKFIGFYFYYWVLFLLLGSISIIGFYFYLGQNKPCELFHVCTEPMLTKSCSFARVQWNHLLLVLLSPLGIIHG